ncbi:hypothetical protein Scep_009887 [Stephania cephalantha]|uniref:Uncharacterized protein n=1 Tax=Stephania cephalantha TaxID=152367 RepID=A0AAP0JUE9_9MAGN
MISKLPWQYIRCKTSLHQIRRPQPRQVPASQEIQNTTKCPVGIILEKLPFINGSILGGADGGDQRRRPKHGAGRASRALDTLAASGTGEWSGRRKRTPFRRLAGLDEAGGAVDADDRVSGDFGVEGAAVAVLSTRRMRLIQRRLRGRRGWRACRG